jgi:hypothetical protein
MGGRPGPDYPPGPGYPEASRPVPGYADAPYPDQTYPDQTYPEQSYSDQSFPDPQSHPDPQRYPDPSYPDPSYPDQQRYPDQPSADGPDDRPVGRSELASGRSRGGETGPRVQGQSLGRLLAALAWPVMAIGLFVSETGTTVLGRMPAWSAFALVCLMLVGVGAFGGAQGPGSGRTWTLGVVGASGLVAFWVLLVLPVISRNTSFALTLGVALAVAAVWLTPGRPRPKSVL